MDSRRASGVDRAGTAEPAVHRLLGMTASRAYGYARRRWKRLRARRQGVSERVNGVDEPLLDERFLRAPRAAPTRGTPQSLDNRFFVSCIMPAYNEHDGIRDAVQHVRQAAEQLTAGFEIIVVDDGSTDGTGRVLEEIADETVRVVRLPENRGYGYALRVGFETAVHPLVFFTDSDDQFDPMDLGRLLPLVAEADVVVGYRVPRSDGAVRSVLSDGYNMLVRRLLGVRVRDVNCAFKLVRRDVLSILGLTANGYAINAEMLARASRCGLRIRQVPVRHRPRVTGHSKVGLRSIPQSLLQVLALRHALRRGSASPLAIRSQHAEPRRHS
jgi:dolichol-phosphate mannosyltransferase